VSPIGDSRADEAGESYESDPQAILWHLQAALTSANALTITLVQRQSTPFRVTIDVTRSIMLSPVLDQDRDLGSVRLAEVSAPSTRGSDPDGLSADPLPARPVSAA